MRLGGRVGRWAGTQLQLLQHAAVQALGLCVLRDQQQARRWEENLKMCKEHREWGGGSRKRVPRSWGVRQGGESAHGKE